MSKFEDNLSRNKHFMINVKSFRMATTTGLWHKLFFFPSEKVRLKTVWRQTYIEGNLYNVKKELISVANHFAKTKTQLLNSDLRKFCFKAIYYKWCVVLSIISTNCHYFFRNPRLAIFRFPNISCVVTK